MRLASVLIFLPLMALDVSAQSSWQLVWNDEFDGVQYALPDSTKWVSDIGGGGWGNAELETYTNLAANASLDGQGHLLIHASQDSTGQITSARLKTQGRFSIAYGKIEARIKLPYGQGMWPAFWMLGADIDDIGWPDCGEIDIMENLGMQPSMVHGTLHGPGYSGAQSIGTSYTLPDGQKLSDDFHVFGVTWSPEMIEFYIDSTVYAQVTPAFLPPGTNWVFDKPFSMLLNLAVGGDWGGNPDSTTVFPQTMTVDYVRVYRNASEPIINPGYVLNIASLSNQLAPGSVAVISGTGFADAVTSGLSSQSYPTSVNGSFVYVNHIAAPITYIAPTLIYVQVPWETPVNQPIDVTVVRGGVSSNTESIVLTSTAPAVFLQNGVAEPACYSGSLTPGARCVLFGNGFGQKTAPGQDGVSPSTALSTAAPCSLTIGGHPLLIVYCGAAPGQIIDELDFIYPWSIPPGTGTIPAILQVGSQTIQFPILTPGA